ncbi:MAG: RluA family pseudouridine synthase [Parachlamydiaceae bacterium]|nr:RluA family pseudouridine synthase [Parachlamydiaceae bacterium]
MEEETFFITEEEAGERLDKVLSKRFCHAGSRTYFQFLIDEGKVLLNGAPIKKRNKAIAGDEIEVEFILTAELELKPENIPLEIVYEDESLLVVNKAPGMVVHPGPGHWSGTFVNALLYYCREAFASTDILNEKDPQQALRPGIVHRLDKDTSGLLIAAKTPLAQQRLIEMFTNRQVHKEYLAICIGNPGVGEIDAPIGRHPSNRKMMAVVEEGRKALTHHRVLAYNSKLSLVNVVIATGRTHQIRVHMKHRGHPVLGDDIYGLPQVNEQYGAQRQLLHAHILRFTHPITGKTIELKVEMPKDMQRILEKNKVT